MAGGWKWINICNYYLAVIPVLYAVPPSPLQSALSIKSQVESLLRSLHHCLLGRPLYRLLESLLESLIEDATLESCA